jgi:hypothetical protein
VNENACHHQMRVGGNIADATLIQIKYTHPFFSFELKN